MKIRFRYDKNSLKQNYALNVIRLASAAVVYLVTSPYINRILGAYYVGKVEFVNTVINYFVLFSALGIPMYGIREVAKNKYDNILKARLVAELLSILTITTVISYGFLLCLMYFTGNFSDDRALFFLMSIIILLSNIGCEWYFQGNEEHLYITVRYIIVRLIVVLLVYTGIDHPDDYLIYAMSIVLITCGANFLNFYYISKLIISQYKNLIIDFSLRKHLKPILTIFVATLSVNLYLQLDYLLIKYYTSDEYVGYYAVANKLIRFFISFLTVIGVVALPKLSYLYHQDRDEYNKLIKKTFTYLLLASLPSTVIFLVFAEFIIGLIGGTKFEASILTMRILSPLCVIVSTAYVIGFLILYPQNKEKIYTFSVSVSAIISVIINIFAIKAFKQNGAAAVGVLAEALAVILMYIYVRKEKLTLSLANKNLLKIFISAIVMLIIACSFTMITEDFWMLLTGIMVSLLAYLSTLYILKEYEFLELITVLKKIR